MIVHRILLAILLLLGSASFMFTQFLDMTFIANLTYPELGADKLSDERRLELVEGLRRGTAIQFQANIYAYRVALATMIVAAFALFLSFRKRNV